MAVNFCRRALQRSQLFVLKPCAIIRFATQISSCRPLRTHSRPFDGYPASISRKLRALHAESLVALDIAATLKLPELPATIPTFRNSITLASMPARISPSFLHQALNVSNPPCQPQRKKPCRTVLGQEPFSAPVSNLSSVAEEVPDLPDPFLRPPTFPSWPPRFTASWASTPTPTCASSMHDPEGPASCITL